MLLNVTLVKMLFEIPPQKIGRGAWGAGLLRRKIFPGAAPPGRSAQAAV